MDVCFFRPRPRGGTYYEEPIVLTAKVKIYNEKENILQVRDSFHQGGDCQACQNQGVQTQEIRQD